MSEPTLFGGYEPPPPPPSRDPDLSADRRRTLRQAEDIRQGRHPLTGGPLHLLADIYASADDGKNLPYRCGSCRFREVLRHHDRNYPKCLRDWWVDGRRGRATNGAGSDVRAWWPACRDYEPGDTSLSPDAARSLP